MKKIMFILWTTTILLMISNTVNATYIDYLDPSLKDRGQKDADEIAKYIETLDSGDGNSFDLNQGGLTFLTKIDLPSTDLDGYSIDSKGTSGQWFAPEDSDVDFVIVKAGSKNSGGGYSIFLADNNLWNTVDLSSHDISHISFWSAPKYDAPNNPTGDSAQVPEPATILLLGSGLLGLLGYRKKFRKPKA